ncbi:MAG: complement resistance protein TraT [Anaerolineae bacterium]|nr:complement resistance protein TraT [Anaerolineae bacterium]
MSVNHLDDSLRSYVRQAQEIDDWVRRVGTGFLEADRRRRLRPMDLIHFDPMGVWREVDKWEDRWESIQPIVGGMITAVSLHPGTAYAGQIIIDMPDMLRHFVHLRTIRKWAGLSPYLNHIKAASLPSHMVHLDLVIAVPVIIYKCIRNLRDYEGMRLIGAITTDTLLTLAPIGGGFAGAKIGALIGTWICPGVGTAAGAILGYIIGKIVTNWMIDRHDVRETMIDGIETGLQKTGVIVRRGARAVDGAVQSTVEAVSHGMQESARMLGESVISAGQSLRGYADRIDTVVRPTVRAVTEHVAAGGQDVVESVREVGRTASTVEAAARSYVRAVSGGISAGVGAVQQSATGISHAAAGVDRVVSSIVGSISQTVFGFGSRASGLQPAS